MTRLFLHALVVSLLPVDAQWAAQVTIHTIARINAHLPPIDGLPKP